MDRADAAGFGVAAAGHVALFALLSVGFAASNMPEVRSAPMEVAFVEEVGLDSTAPVPTQEMPAPLAGPPDVPPTPAAGEPAPAPPAPATVAQPRPAPPAPAPAPVQQRVQPRPPAPRPPAQAQQLVHPRPSAPGPAKQTTTRRNPGGLNIDLSGSADSDTDSRSTEPPAAVAGPQVQASLVAEVRRRVKPHWKAPTGADAEQLRTEVLISLDRGGRVTDVQIVSTSGQTASNRPQVPLHREQAVRAVRLGAPFLLPAQFYDAWKQIKITFDKRLSQ